MKKILNPEIDTNAEKTILGNRHKVARTFVIASLILSGCRSDNESAYSPKSDSVCALIAAKIIAPKYEADRWTDQNDIPRLSEEITKAVSTVDQLPTYTICFDENGRAHAIAPEMILSIQRYNLESPKGYSLGATPIPGIINQTTMEATRQTAITEVHGL